MWLRCAAIASAGDPVGRNGEKAGAPKSSRTRITEPVMAMLKATPAAAILLTR
jgi:hypothetical protein